MTRRNGRNTRAHQAAWLDADKEIPSGYQLHHVCRNKLCINVKHLQLVTAAEHTRLHSRDPRNHRSGNTDKTHCIHDHEFTLANTYINSLGHRKCRRCAANREHKRRAADLVKARDVSNRANTRYREKLRKLGVTRLADLN